VAVPFNKEATRWPVICLDSQLTLKDDHAVRIKEAKQARGRIHRLTGKMGLSAGNYRKVMTACIQSVAMFGWELRWKGIHVQGTVGRADGLQQQVNQEARGVTGCREDQPRSTLDGVGPQCSVNAAGEQTAAAPATATDPTTGKPCTRDCRRPNGDRTVAHECPRLRRNDRM